MTMGNYAWPQPMRGHKPTIWFGGDYNPEQWPETVWDEDIRLMKQAKVSIVTLGVFSWALLEPEEGVFDFSWMDRIVNKLYEAGIAVDMATATASPPRWLTEKHPEILPVDDAGASYWPGARQHWRPTSRVFRAYALTLTRAMAEHFRDCPALVSWHVSNELGCHNVFDYSDDAAREFREWCRRRYTTLDGLNAAWNGPFWSQMVTDWNQIIPPRQTLGGHNPTTMLDFKRFSSDALLEYYKSEAQILHEVTPGIPVTTNLMVIENDDTNPVDCFKWSKELDFVSNDHYYLPDGRHLDEMAMSAAIVSGMAEKKPWFLMENSTSSTNWRAVNLRKQPGEIVRDALVHVAYGADAICFFQWRQSAAGAEKFHSAMLPHYGERSKNYQEICNLGQILEDISPVLESGVVRSPLAMVYDYDSWWALQNGILTKEFHYREEVLHWYRASLDAGVSPDFVGAHDEWSVYPVVMFPVTYLTDDSVAERARRYVEQGGRLIVTYASGIVDDYDHVVLGGYPGAFRDLLGINVEEFVAIAPGHTVTLDNGWRGTLWADDCSSITDDCVVIARVAESDDRGIYGQPLVTCRRFGKGKALYVGTKLQPGDAADFIRLHVLDGLDDAAPYNSAMPKILRLTRVGAQGIYHFLFNRTDDDVHLTITGRILAGMNIEIEAADSIALHTSGVVVIQEDRQ